MKTNFPERIIEMLRGSSNGLTSKDIAERLGTTGGNISSRLSTGLVELGQRLAGGAQ